MRLAHLHFPELIPYTHSLRLQNVLLEKHFTYKSLIRSSRPPHSPHGWPSVAKESSSEENTPDDENVRVIADTASNEKATAARQGRDTRLSSGVVPRPLSVNQSPSLATGEPATHQSSEKKNDVGVGEKISAFLGSSVPPDPVLLTFSTPPTYTVGRRHLANNPISPEQQSFLTANGLASFYASPRGGLLTYHAPGQLTGYVIADLRRHGITARCWMKLLEESVMRTCAVWGVQTTRTDDPGVWIKDSGRDDTNVDMENDQRPTRSTSAFQSDRKICAIGVHVSRGVTSHGVGLNVCDAAFRYTGSPIPATASIPGPSSSFPCSPSSSATFDFTSDQTESPSYDAVTRGYLSWGFSRIVACGLEGKSVTWLTRELPKPQARPSPPTSVSVSSSSSSSSSNNTSSSTSPIPLDSVADALAREVCHGLNIMKADGKESVDGVYRISEADILPTE